MPFGISGQAAGLLLSVVKDVQQPLELRARSCGRLGSFTQRSRGPDQAGAGQGTVGGPQSCRRAAAAPVHVEGS